MYYTYQEIACMSRGKAEQLRCLSCRKRTSGTRHLLHVLAVLFVSRRTK